MIERLGSHWWLFLVRGILALVFGLVVPFAPGAALLTLAFFFGAYAFVDGVVAIATAVRMNHAEGRWIWMFVQGLLGLAVGIFTVFAPALVALWLIFLFGAWAIVTGVLAIGSAFRLRQAIAGEVLMILLGIISIAAGVFTFISPLFGALALVWTISVYAILVGIFLIGLAFRLRRLQGVAAGSPA
jgi:uncharacterized membrane protein HdeD (DUF308 family)